jgi:outer membrane biosynthesis protein TonB
MDEFAHPALPSALWARRIALVAIVCMATLAGGCAALEEALNPPEAQPAAAEPEPPPVVEPALPPAPRPRPSQRVARLPAPAERPQPTAQPQPQASPPVEAQPEPLPESVGMPEIKLVGMSRGETATLLGAPTEERDAAPAKIWKFMSGDCAVDVYFYLDVARNDFYALHYIVQDRFGATTGEPAERCLQRIYSESRK